MSRNFTTSNKAEKILEENPFLIILECKVIFKSNNDSIAICLDQISNVRLRKTRDTTLNILVLLFTFFFYLLLESQYLNFVSQSLYITLISFLVVISFSLEKYTYKLLINKGKFGFDVISISKNNIVHAKNFMAKYDKINILKSNKQEFNFEAIKI